MLIVGAGGLVLQMIDDFIHQSGNKVTCWADMLVHDKIVNENCTIISSDDEVRDYFKLRGDEFVVAIGDPALRNMLTKKFQLLGGTPISFISSKAIVSSFCSIGQGVIVLHGTIIEAGCNIGNGVLINSNTTITHEVTIGEFTEIGPGVTVAGKVSIGSESFIGAGTTIIPGVCIGNKAIVGAGSLVLQNVVESDLVAGVPAKSIKK